MGTISKCFYGTVNDLTNGELATSYLYDALMSLSPKFVDEYDAYQRKQISVRNTLIGDAYKNREIPSRPDLSTSVISFSATKNNPVTVVEY